jgi:hypothetical protein
LAAATLIVTTDLLFACQSQQAPEPADRSDRSPVKKIDLQKLVGRWLRTDGGYILDIRTIGTDGRMEAAYLNPRPIRVAQAKASQKGTTAEVFLELRDEGYPGSTYTLVYDPGQDVLSGIYFQAAMGQSFQVLFVRSE